MISILLLPFLTCVALVLIHTYFGSIVLKRGIIFIDLALAQWAALGYLVGHWLDFENQVYLFLIGFSFTIFAALILTLLKPVFNKPNLQEAIIGVSYILGISIAYCLIVSTGMEGHHLNEMLSGHLLFVSLAELKTTYILYSIIFLFILWKHHSISNKHSLSWTFIFYVLFGLVVTSSVKMVGILLVFSFLVIPLLSITLFTNKLSNQLKAGWAIGIISSFIGLLLSLFTDLPPSFCIILTLISIWIVSIPLNIILRKPTN